MRRPDTCGMNSIAVFPPRGIPARAWPPGDYLMFLDADDELTPDAVEKMLHAVETAGASWCITDTYRITGNRVSVARFNPPDGDPFLAILAMDLITMGFFFRRADFEEIGMFDETLRASEDWEFFIRMMEGASHFVICRSRSIDTIGGKAALQPDTSGPCSPVIGAFWTSTIGGSHRGAKNSAVRVRRAFGSWEEGIGKRNTASQRSGTDSGAYSWREAFSVPGVFWRELSMACNTLRGVKNEQVEAEGQSHRFGWFGSHGPIDGKQHVFDSRGIEIGCRGDAALSGEHEIVREGFDGAGHPIAADAAQFDQILGCGKGYEQTAAVPQNTPEFGSMHPPRDRQDQMERALGVGYEAIGIGNNPLTGGVAACGGFDCWN